MNTQPKDKIIELAEIRGSVAFTHAGARRYLLNHFGKMAEAAYPLEGCGIKVRTEKYPSGNIHVYPPSRATSRQKYQAKRAADIVARLDAPRLARAAEFARWTIQQEDAAIESIERSWNLRKAETQWAGGMHNVSVYFGIGAWCEGGSEKAWSANGRWTGTNSWAHLGITWRAFHEFGPNGLVIGGLITLDAEKVAPRCYRAVWVKQGRGFSLRTVEGWIIKGYHVVGGTLERARAYVDRMRKLSVKAAMDRRATAVKRRSETAGLRRVWVSFDDSISAGNCHPGTTQMHNHLCELLGGRIGAVRADYLLAVRDDYYTRRAVAKAALRYI